MERLSEKRDGQNVIPLRQDGTNKWALCSAGMGEAPVQYLYGDHADRIAAYEDTGLVPEQIVEYMESVFKLIDAIQQETAGWNDFVELLKDTASTDRLRELIQADLEDRLVVIDDAMALAMVAGGRAISHNKRLIGASYLYDIWEVEGPQKEITYAEAARLLSETGYAALKGDNHES